jgi:hypothetical protein
MSTRHVQLADGSRAVLAVAEVADEGDHFGGTIDLRSTPAEVRALFEEFEEIVNGQVFVLLDEIQGKIGALPIRAIFDDGLEADIEDLQVFPSTGDVSFRLAGEPKRGRHEIRAGI